MAVSILQTPAAVDQPLPRKRFTRSEVARMAEIGLFDGQRFELIDGDLIDKMGQKPPHANAIRRCMRQLLQIFGADSVLIQLPIEAGAADREWNQPEPDLAVLSDAEGEFSQRHPNGSELALAIEIADTSLYQDMARKRELYARAGVPEYWVLDLNGRRLIVHRALNPQTAQYDRVLGYAEHETIAVACRPSPEILVSALLP